MLMLASSSWDKPSGLGKKTGHSSLRAWMRYPTVTEATMEAGAAMQLKEIEAPVVVVAMAVFVE